MNEKIDALVRDRIMERAIEISRACPDSCRYFQICSSDQYPESLILKWTVIDIDDPDRPIQTFRFECFDQDGEPQNCSIHYSNNQEANEFFWSLKTLHTQVYASDHITEV